MEHTAAQWVKHMNDKTVKNIEIMPNSWAKNAQLVKSIAAFKCQKCVALFVNRN